MTASTTRTATGQPPFSIIDVGFAELWVVAMTALGFVAVAVATSGPGTSSLPFVMLLLACIALQVMLRRERTREAAIEFTIGTALMLGAASLLGLPVLAFGLLMLLGFGGGNELLLPLAAPAFLATYAVAGLRRLRGPARPGSVGAPAVIAGFCWPFALVALATAEAPNRAFLAIEQPVRAAVRGLRPVPRPVVAHSQGEVQEERVSAGLSSLAVAQEEYWTDRQRYASSLDSLGTSYVPADGAAVTIVVATEQDWAAVARHPSMPGRECRMVNRPEAIPAAWKVEHRDRWPQCVAVP